MSLWKGDAPLVLASASVIRKALAQAAGLPVEVIPAIIDERAIESTLEGAAPAEIARALALTKAETVSATCPGRYVLGADQILALGGRLLHKPATRQQAADQLGLIAGRSHQLHSAMAIAINGRAIWTHVETATLTARPFAGAFIHAYLDSVGDSVLGSVGAYHIEGAGIHLFDRIEGDHTIIMGLPLIALLRQLRNLDLVHE